MLRVLLDLLVDCGVISVHADSSCSWSGGAARSWRPSSADAETIARAFEGQMEFFDQCLNYADAFLSGQPPLFNFSGGSTHAWERLLGNGEFAFARSVVARLLLPRVARGAEILVLCYGPGYDLVEIENRRPDVRVTALDFTNTFFANASRRLRRPDAVQWIDAARWCGFGFPLPFDDRSFDMLLFSCADPYIPPASREAVYRDIYRVLRPGGVLGILTHSYPDAAHCEVPDEWIRRGTFCHDFLESVCQGWQGFYGAAESRDLFARVGFRRDVVTLNSSVWRLVRPGTE
jgi:ubiquinone/menaquinone biosynthesis C-methylase UbiE